MKYPKNGDRTVSLENIKIIENDRYKNGYSDTRLVTSRLNEQLNKFTKKKRSYTIYSWQTPIFNTSANVLNYITVKLATPYVHALNYVYHGETRRCWSDAIHAMAKLSGRQALKRSSAKISAMFLRRCLNSSFVVTQASNSGVLPGGSEGKANE